MYVAMADRRNVWLINQLICFGVRLVIIINTRYIEVIWHEANRMYSKSIK